MNSRMKDFYDIYTLLTTNDFAGRVLFEAVFETFQRRGTVLEKEHPLFQTEFAEDDSRTRQWIAFLRRTGIEEQLSFKDVMSCIIDFLEPIYQSILDEQEFFCRWNSVSRTWIKKN